MENIIELQLLAVDFRGTDYIGNCDCAISKAAKRQLNPKDEVIEYVYGVFIGQDTFEHELYLPDHFDKDKSISKTKKDHEIVRTITLTKVQNEKAF